MGEKNDLISAVASDDVVDRVEHLVEYLSCRVFGQSMYRHVTLIFYIIFLKLINYIIEPRCKALPGCTVGSRQAEHESQGESMEEDDIAKSRVGNTLV